MPVNLSIKNVPDELADRLREQAKRNRRSLQGELLAILEEKLKEKERPLTFEEAYQRIKALRFKTEGDSTAIIRELRDAR